MCDVIKVVMTNYTGPRILIEYTIFWNLNICKICCLEKRHFNLPNHIICMMNDDNEELSSVNNIQTTLWIFFSLFKIMIGGYHPLPVDQTSCILSFIDLLLSCYLLLYISKQEQKNSTRTINKWSNGTIIEPLKRIINVEKIKLIIYYCGLNCIRNDQKRRICYNWSFTSLRINHTRIIRIYV